MNKKYGLSIILIVVALSLLGAGNGVPAHTTITKNFTVGSSYGARTSFNLNIKEAGCILAEATWRGSANTLSLILNGPDDTKAYKRQDGKSGLVLAYSVTTADLRRGSRWSIAVANFSDGSAKGSLAIEIPPTQVPCEVAAKALRGPGRIALSWRYTGSNLPASFLVERSTNNRSWGVVPVCKRSASRLTTDYDCVDTDLTSGARYFYRVCSVPSPSTSRCGTSNVSPPVSVQAP